MPASTIYKPGTYKGPVFLVPAEGTREPPIITTADGQTFTGSYLNTNEGRHQFVFPRELYGLENLTVSYGGQTGSLGNGSLAYESFGGLDQLARRAGGKGDLGSGGFGGGAGGFPQPGMAPGGYGVYPANLEGLFPDPVLAEFSPIKTAPYSFTDPAEYLRGFGEFQRGEIDRNFAQAQDIALQQLDTELQGLKNYVPAAAALKREQLAYDNLFNAAQRRGAVDFAIPGARSALEAQTGRAEIYAQGRLPDALTDRALELNIRSRAADQGAAGGFGPQSVASGKISDLMSAEQRFAIAQYGEQALNQSISNRANLLLPPTQYSTVGQEVRAVPEIGAGRLSAQNLSLISQLASVPASQALSTTVQQNQFTTGLEQQTRQYNATNQFAESQYNAGTQNSFALQKFGYQVGFAGAVAGAYQTDINTQFAIAQQEQYRNTFQDNMAAAQAAGQAGAVGQGLGALPGIISGIGQIINGPAGTATPTGTETDEGTTVSQDDGGFAIPPVDLDQPIEVSPTPDFGTNPDLPSVGSGPQEVQPAPDSGPDYTVSPEVDDFLNDQQIPKTAAIRSQSAVTQNLLKSGNIPLTAAGMSTAPTAQSVPVGYTNRGIPMYSNAALARSTDGTLGARAANVFRGMLDPLGVLSREDSSYLDRVATLSSDAAFIASLGQNFANGDSRAFVGNLLGRMGVPLSRELSGDPQSQAGFQAGFQAYQIFNNWGRMSPAQKGLAISALGLKGMYAATGKDIAKTPIVKPGQYGANSPGLNVGEALNLFQAGYNVYHLVKDWDQMSTMDKIVGGTQTAASIANTARQFGLLGAGSTGAAVPGITAQGLANAGFQQASSYGIGAVAGPATNVPAGYTVTAQLGNGQVVAMPTANIGSSTAAQSGALGAEAGAQTGTAAAGELTAGQTAGAVVGGVAGAATFAAGAYQVYKGWGTGGAAGRKNGAAGGAMMAAGLYGTGTAAGALGYATYAGAATNPYVLAAVVVASIALSSIHSGKEKQQMERDGVRKFWDKQKFTQDNQIMLADGTKFDIGREESFTHSIKDRAKLEQYSPQFAKKSGGRDLRGYETDFTNDMDYTASMGGVALSRLLAGGKERNVDHMGGYLGNAALGNVGYGKEMTRENFDKTMQNMRGFYSQAGIKSKADAYALANQAYAEGRLNDFDHASTLNSINVVFDADGYDTAQKLMAGRWRGLEVVAEGNPDDAYRKPESDQPNIDPGFRLPEGQEPGTGTTGGGTAFGTIPFRPGPGGIDPGFQAPPGIYGNEAVPGNEIVFQGDRQVPKTGSRSRMTKAEVIAENRRRYGNTATVQY